MTNSVIIASAGRPTQVSATVHHLTTTVRDVGQILVCVPDQESLPPDPMPGATVLLGPRGASAQRNHALQQLSGDTEYVFFFDDDCLPHAEYLTNGAQAFRADPNVAGITGRVLKDGARRAAVPLTEAFRLLSGPINTVGGKRPAYSLYGCNFAVRRPLLAMERFDERLPLYSWLEDEDLSQRLSRHGTLQVVLDCTCVHLGTDSGGRTNHKRLGYSLVTNPVYLWRKGSITARRTAWLVLRPLVGNLLGLLGHDRVDRLDRLRGALLSAIDLLRGRVTPERITTL